MVRNGELRFLIRRAGLPMLVKSRLNIVPLFVFPLFLSYARFLCFFYVRREMVRTKAKKKKKKKRKKRFDIGFFQIFPIFSYDIFLVFIRASYH